MSKNKERILMICGIILAVFLVITLAIPFPKANAVFWLSFIFGIIAICAQPYVMKIAFEKGEPLKSKFYGYPIAKIGMTYLAVQLIASIVMMTLRAFVPVPAWVAAVPFVLILAASSVGFISADIMREEVERQDRQLKKDVHTMRTLQSKTAYIVTQCTDDGLKPVLHGLAEKFRFSDPVSSEALEQIENDLTSMVDELQAAVMENDTESARALCDKAAAALEQRNTMCKLNK